VYVCVCVCIQFDFYIYKRFFLRPACTLPDALLTCELLCAAAEALFDSSLNPWDSCASFAFLPWANGSNTGVNAGYTTLKLGGRSIARSFWAVVRRADSPLAACCCSKNLTTSDTVTMCERVAFGTSSLKFLESVTNNCEFVQSL